MSEPETQLPAEKVRTEEEQARIMLAAQEARSTVILVAALAIGSMIFMFLITLVVVALTW